MVNSIFKRTPGGGGGGGGGVGGGCGGGNNTFFASTANIPRIDLPYISRNDNIFYNFNLKIKFVTQTLNRIVYHDNEYPVDAMRNEYNIILYQLGRLKEDVRLQNDGYYAIGTNLTSTSNRYSTVLNNTITTFASLITTYDPYIQRVHDEFILLPDSTYSHIYYLKEFLALLSTESAPVAPVDPAIDEINQSLELVLVSLYDNIGIDIQALLVQFSSGQMEEIKDALTYEMYTNLSQKLVEENRSGSIGYSRAHEVLLSSLEGLYKSAILERSHTDEVKRLYEQVALYRDKTTGGGLMKGTATITEVGTIRPEVIEYVRLHGFPPDGVFEADKLAAIISDLNIDYD